MGVVNKCALKFLHAIHTIFIVLSYSGNYTGTLANTLVLVFFIYMYYCNPYFIIHRYSRNFQLCFLYLYIYYVCILILLVS